MSYSHFFSKNISIYAIFNDQNFNDMLTNDIVSFEQLCGPSVSSNLWNGGNLGQQTQTILIYTP